MAEQLLVDSPLHEQLTEDLTCGVCLEEYKDPRALPCLHVYCRACLDVLIARSRDPKYVACPVCRKEARTPDCATSEGFPSDFRIKRLLELRKTLDKHTKAQRQVSQSCVCNVCQSVQVNGFCDTCGPLCSECLRKEEKTSHKV